MSHLKVGDKAPEFKGVDQNGNAIDLNQYVGKKVVLYFYPKDDTPGCTAQACNLRDNFDVLKEKGIEVLGVSTDSIKSHAKFVDKFKLNFTLIADENKEIVEKFGVWGLKKFMGREYMGINRTTFVLDKDKNILKVFENVKPLVHAKEVLEFIQSKES